MRLQPLVSSADGADDPLLSVQPASDLPCGYYTGRGSVDHLHGVPVRLLGALQLH